MSGHYHNPNSGTQNQGNSLGSRSCVRQSKLYRKYESGNGVKAALGVSHLAWNENKKEGAYAGHAVWCADTSRPTHTQQPPAREHESERDAYPAVGHGRVPPRAPLREYGRRPEMPASYASGAPPAARYRDDREPMPQPARRQVPADMDAYERRDRQSVGDMRRGGSFSERNSRAPAPQYDRPSYPERGYERDYEQDYKREYESSGYAQPSAFEEPSYERGPYERAEVPSRTYAAPEASRLKPASYGAYDVPPMRARGENENISNLTGGAPRGSYDRDLEYAALNARVSDVEKRMVLASKTRPW